MRVDAQNSKAILLRIAEAYIYILLSEETPCCKVRGLPNSLVGGSNTDSSSSGGSYSEEAALVFSGP